ncbi:hypothetical protein ACFX2B_018037 [Malus domestica]
MASTPRLVKKRGSTALTGDEDEWSLGLGEQIDSGCVGFPHRSASLHFGSGLRIERRVEAAEHAMACRTRGSFGLDQLGVEYRPRESSESQGLDRGTM